MSERTWVPVPEGSPFPVENLPLGIGARSGGRPTAWVAIGDDAVDLAAIDALGAFVDIELPDRCWSSGRLNEFLAAGPAVWSMVRAALGDLLTDRAAADRLARAIVSRADLVMGLPVAVGDFVDFYSSIHHATNVGRIFRPDAEPLLPNWRHLPVGYHGRSGTIVADGAEIRRPAGLRMVDGEPLYGPSRRLDIELEVGTIVGVGSDLGRPVTADRAGDHLYGLCLVNDWSARDIQAFEYQPLGPFLGKSFATSVSPWLVSFEALEPYRTTPPVQKPPVADHLRLDEPWAFDVTLEVLLQTSDMRARGQAAATISRTCFADMYWTPAQQFAHVTANGASSRPGDLLGSGTVSGPERGSEGSLIELTWNGERPIELPDGSTRTFLVDGDRVTLRGWAGGDGGPRLGLGEVTGTVVPNEEER
ncbi:MAG: fumarylacetoacetase [Actinomycetota bacterium]